MNDILMPINGDIKLSEDSSDSFFSANVLGKGVVIEPSSDTLVAPFDGVYYQQNNNSIHIKTEFGTWLIHIGINIAGIEKNYVSYKFNNGDVIKANTKLAIIDWQKITENLVDVIQEVAVINLDQTANIIDFTPSKYQTGDIIAKLVPNKGVLD